MIHISTQIDYFWQKFNLNFKNTRKISDNVFSVLMIKKTFLITFAKINGINAKIYGDNVHEYRLSRKVVLNKSNEVIGYNYYIGLIENDTVIKSDIMHSSLNDKESNLDLIKHDQIAGKMFDELTEMMRETLDSPDESSSMRRRNGHNLY